MTKPINDEMMKILDSGMMNHIFEIKSPYRRMKNQVTTSESIFFFIGYTTCTHPYTVCGDNKFTMLFPIFLQCKRT